MFDLELLDFLGGLLESSRKNDKYSRFANTNKKKLKSITTNIHEYKANTNSWVPSVFAGAFGSFCCEESAAPSGIFVVGCLR